MITLKTLPQATAQEVFEQIVNHLLKQKFRSYSETHEQCVYRGPEGLMCAAGCLMSDEEYNSHRIREIGWMMLVEGGKVPSTHSSLIHQMQYIHDQYKTGYTISNPQFMDDLEGVCIDFGVSLDFLKWSGV